MENTSSSPRRVQKFIVKKKRSIECFADAQMQRKSETEIGGIQSKSASKTLIMSDPQNISVSATVSLGVKNDVDLLKIAECRLKSTSDDISKALHSSASQLHKAQPQQAIIQKANITNVDATQNCPRPILVVHPAQKCFSHTAIRTFKTLADSTSTNDNTAVNTIIQLNGDEINDAEDDKKVSVDDWIGDAVNGKHFKTTDKTDNIDGNITISDNNGIDANNNNNNDAKSTTKYESHAPMKSTNPSITKFTLSKGLFSVPSRFSRDTKKELTFEVTEASSDRLQKWKSKLQTGRRHKDTSEPPPIIRSSSGENGEPMKVQELVMKKKRSNEAFAETKSLFERTTAGEGSAGSGTATRADAGIGTQIKT
ncbi:unnamed protein product [Anisakis simplex]|uniref:PH domain-containing protein n=1 Tax=Anisakis simplex TaxID=6269 RepID=A0A0M3KBP5_ANISI|nr:unnamed protein product [Anisakis simplex]